MDGEHQSYQNVPTAEDVQRETEDPLGLSGVKWTADCEMGWPNPEAQ